MGYSKLFVIRKEKLGMIEYIYIHVYIYKDLCGSLAALDKE